MYNVMRYGPVISPEVFETMNTNLITREFNGTPFVFREDGWFNMTKAAQHFGKKLSHFWDSPDTTSYVEAVGQLPEFRGIELEDARKGRYGGTWAHPSWPCSSPAGWT